MLDRELDRHAEGRDHMYMVRTGSRHLQAVAGGTAPSRCRAVPARPLGDTGVLPAVMPR